MTWERFGYICRRASVDRQENERIAKYLSTIEHDKACGLYGKDISSQSLPRKILDKISQFERDKDAQQALEIYRELDLTRPFEEPMRFKRIVAYLSYVMFVFYIVMSVYQLKVAPSFLEAFENFGVQIPGHLGFYRDYWGHFVLAISIILLFALLIASHLKKIFQFRLGLEDRWVMRFLVFPSIRRSYIKVINILQFPLQLESATADSGARLTMNHLNDIRESNLDVTREMQELIDIEMRSLLENCERQMKYITFTVALIIVFAVFFFLSSAYSPIFILGETV